MRDSGYTGKVNPAIMRELTGINRPGVILCELRSDGYLVDAGKIHLPAHRGSTKANEYTINPKSDLMPRAKYDVSTHQLRKRQKEQVSSANVYMLNQYLLNGCMQKLLNGCMQKL